MFKMYIKFYVRSKELQKLLLLKNFLSLYDFKLPLTNLTFII